MPGAPHRKKLNSGFSAWAREFEIRNIPVVLFFFRIYPSPYSDVRIELMNAIRQNPRDGPDGAAQDVLVIGGGRFGLAVAECLTEGARSVTLVSETEPVDITDEMRLIQRTPLNASDVRTLASEVADVDLVVVGSDSEALLPGYVARREFDPCDVVAVISDPANGPAFEGTDVDLVDMPRLLVERIRDRYE